MSTEDPTDGFTVPVGDRYFEDYTADTTHACGSLTVTERDIIDFASRFDPQAFHIDPVAAEDGPFGGLVASGWHTAALMMKLFAAHYLSTVASLGSPGVDELRWLKPVRPGDRLHLRVHILETRPSRSDPGRGIVRSLAELLDDDGAAVLRVTVVNLLRTRTTP
ncbi:MaoC family dehydratase [Streptomyces sp. NBC_00442]|uniref:MaoC family dehydratase n=1 Tax=Streptomyces sp. NBC_00442 TaxID=2903651 RepID=UPI002E1A7C62